MEASRLVSPSVSIDELRRRLRAPAGAPGAPRVPLPTGAPSLDEALGGGLPAARLSEVAGARSSGKTALILGLLARQTGRGSLAAFIDGRGQLYPPAAVLFGVDLGRLLLARVADASADEVARAAEIVARSRAFSLVAVDLPGGAGISRSRLRRLRAAASSGGAALAILANAPGAVEGAAARLEVRARRRREIEVQVRKGSASGAPVRVSVELGGLRFDPLPLEPAAPPIRRALPGEEVAS